VAILGVGSEFRGDDAAGVFIAARLAKKRFTARGLTVAVYNGATAPENLTGEIRRFKPTHLAVIDTVDAGQRPGTIVFLEPDVAGGASFSTHTIPAKILADYLGRTTGCRTVVIGIQGRTLSFGSAMSPAVRNSVGIVSHDITAALRAIRARRKPKTARTARARKR